MHRNNKIIFAIFSECQEGGGFWYISILSIALYSLYNFQLVHIKIPPISYVDLLLRSTVVATASWSTFEGTMKVP